MFSGSGLCAGCSEGGVGEWGVGVGVVVSPSEVSSVCSAGPSVGSACRASVVIAIAGSSFCSVGVGDLALLAASPSCSSASASIRNNISSSLKSSSICSIAAVWDFTKAW